jgi:hypothetical protein
LVPSSSKNQKKGGHIEPSTHQHTIHWMPVITQLWMNLSNWMNLNYGNISFHLGNQSQLWMNLNYGNISFHLANQSQLWMNLNYGNISFHLANQSQLWMNLNYQKGCFFHAIMMDPYKRIP